MQTLQVGPVQPLRVISAPYNGKRTDAGTIVNNSESVTVYLSDTEDVDAGSVPLAPQASYHADGSEAVYASTVGNGSVQLLKLPSGANWDNPVGVQIALNQLGLAKDSSVNNPAYGPVPVSYGPAKDTTVSGVTTQLSGGPIALPTGAAKDVTVSGVTTALGTPAQTTDVVTTLPGNLKTSGIPPINNHNQLLTLAATSIATGSSNTSAAAAITQPAYEIYVSCYTTAGGMGGVAHVRLDWSDQATGLVVDQDSFWVYPGTGTGTNAHVFKGRGPSKGNQVKVFISVPSVSGAVTFAYTLFQSSRLITSAFDSDSWFTVQSPASSSGPALVASDPIARVLGSESLSVLAGGTSGALGLPLYNGPVWIKFATASGTNDALLEIDDVIDTNFSGSDTTVFKAESDATGRINVLWHLPRVQCLVNLTNNNAAAKTLSFQIIGA